MAIGSPLREVVPRHSDGVEEHVVRDSFPSVLVPQEVKTWLQLRYSSIQEEACQGCAGSKLTAENEIVPEDFVPQIGKAISHGFDLMEQLKSQAPRSSFVNCRLGFPGNVYEATSCCCTFRVLSGSYGGEGSALRPPLFEIRGVSKRNGSARCCGALSTSSDAWYSWEILSL